MTQIAIIFHSASGTTAQLARAITTGVMQVSGCEASIHEILGQDIVEGRFRNEALLAQLDKADALIFGAPTYMGGPSAQFKAFADATSERWETQQWRNKLAAGFTIGSNPNGDQGQTMQYFSILASQHGMLWVGLDIPGGYDQEGRNRLGLQSGMSAHTTQPLVAATDLETATYLGKRVAMLAVTGISKVGNGA
ncbi:flavodoxin family protein [Leeia oryzae]|uniref:flavodoxin family protein n=1 Tax=Leeia oryzae TaxID=356662 RepID=UPI00037DC10A|nr:flavodoxin family protein [Leeia oryzae]